MNSCLLCDDTIASIPTWKKLFKGVEAAFVCEICKSEFEKSNEPNSLYIYNEAMKDYFFTYKFLKDIRLAAVFSAELARFLKAQPHDVITTIPMHSEGLYERTFSHVDTLLHEGGVAFEQLLEKTTNERQGAKNKQERGKVAPLFRKKNGAQIEGLHIVVVDDIRTTGTTLNHAKKVLLDEGAKSVKEIVLATGRNEKI